LKNRVNISKRDSEEMRETFTNSLISVRKTQSSKKKKNPVAKLSSK